LTFDFSTFDFSTFDFSTFDFSTFDFSTFDFSTFWTYKKFGLWSYLKKYFGPNKIFIPAQSPIFLASDIFPYVTTIG